jgi:hypothetical protein
MINSLGAPVPGKVVPVAVGAIYQVPFLPIQN